MTWPSVIAPATAPADHGDVRTQAYMAGGGDYFRSGYYSHGLFTSAATSTVGMTLNLVLLRPFIVPVRRSFDRIGINVTVAASAGGVLRFGLYADAGGVPNSLLVDAGTVASTSTGAKEVVITNTLDPGVWWIATVAQVATCTVTTYATATMAPWVTSSTSPPSTVTTQGGWHQTGVSGALPSTLTLTGPERMPAACLRAA